MPFCKNCGAKVDEGAAFCPNCGNRIGSPVQIAAPQDNMPRERAKKPIIVAKRSFIGTYGLFLPFLLLLFFWLIIPLIVFICLVVANSTYTHSIYADRYVYEGGLLSHKEHVQTMTKVLSISFNQSLMGKLFKYGSVDMAVVGCGDIVIRACETLIADGQQIKSSSPIEPPVPDRQASTISLLAPLGAGRGISFRSDP